MQDPRLKTAPNHQGDVRCRAVGPQDRAGWFRYKGADKIDPPSPDYAPDAAPATEVALAEDDETLAAFLRLRRLADRQR